MKEAQKRELDSQISRFHFCPDSRKANTLSMHFLIISFCKKMSKKDLTLNNFSNHVLNIIEQDPKLLEIVEENTRAQSTCMLWFDLRYGRITASKLHEIAHCGTDGSLANSILGVTKKYDNLFMKRGRNLEDDVFNEVSKKMKKSIKKCGVVILEKFPFVAASADGVADDSVFEIKCPISEKTFGNYINNQGEVQIKFKAQLMLQMLAWKKKKGFFCVADPKFEKNKVVTIVAVDYDEDFLMPILEKAIVYWEKIVFNKLIKSIL